MPSPVCPTGRALVPPGHAAMPVTTHSRTSPPWPWQPRASSPVEPSPKGPEFWPTSGPQPTLPFA
jgi:hypothetical protein